jgi:hypothetical protein
VRIERLEVYVGRITTAVRELQHKRRLPTDAWNNVISAAAAGGVVADLAYHLHELSPEVAGIGASGATLGGDHSRMA